MATQGGLMWSVAPPSVTHLLSSRYRIFGLPHLVCFPFRPYPPPPPSTTPPSNPVVSATCACPGRGWGWGGCKGGGLEGWKLRNVSLFDLRGGVCWFNYLLSSLGNPIKTFWGAKFNMCVGGGKRRGQNAGFRGVALLIPFSLLLASFLPVALGSVCRGWLRSSSCVWICFRWCLPTKLKGPVPEIKGP